MSILQSMRRAPAAGLVLALLLTLPTAALAVDPVNKSFLRGVAIKGYDPVAYFEQGQPMEGKSEFSHEWKGATWRFASQANLEKFQADPERYAPRYGGYCAYAVAKGYTADITPHAWAIVDGKLYLNNSQAVQRTWQQDVPGYISRADANWPGLLSN